MALVLPYLRTGASYIREARSRLFVKEFDDLSA